jgi:hypothetical protein
MVKLATMKDTRKTAMRLTVFGSIVNIKEKEVMIRK